MRLTSTLHKEHIFFLSYGVTAGTSSWVEWRDTPAAYWSKWKRQDKTLIVSLTGELFTEQYDYGDSLS